MKRVKKLVKAKPVLWLLMEDGKPMLACAAKAPLVRVILGFREMPWGYRAEYTIVKLQATHAPDAPLLSTGLRWKR